MSTEGVGQARGLGFDLDKLSETYLGELSSLSLEQTTKQDQNPISTTWVRDAQRISPMCGCFFFFLLF